MSQSIIEKLGQRVDPGIIQQRFSAEGLKMLEKVIFEQFGRKPVRMMFQLDLFVGYDELAVLLEGGDMYRCLIADGNQVSDWSVVQKEVR